MEKKIFEFFYFFSPLIKLQNNFKRRKNFEDFAALFCSGKKIQTRNRRFRSDLLRFRGKRHRQHYRRRSLERRLCSLVLSPDSSPTVPNGGRRESQLDPGKDISSWEMASSQSIFKIINSLFEDFETISRACHVRITVKIPCSLTKTVTTSNNKQSIQKIHFACDKWWLIFLFWSKSSIQIPFLQVGFS